MEAPEILTKRLCLTQLIKSDAPAMHAYRSDPEVCRYQSFEPTSQKEVEAFIAGLLENRFNMPGTWFQFGIRLRNSNVLIGDLGVHFMDDDPRQTEIGYTIGPKHQGQGYATEAVLGILGHLFESLGMHRVFASVDPRNAPSIALLERVGMRREAHFRKSLWFKGDWADDMVFAMLESEWRSR